MKFNTGICTVLSLGRNNPRNQYTINVNELERSFTEKDLGVLMNIKLTVGHQCTLATKKANSLLGFIRKRS